MGGSSKKVTVGYKYFLGLHMILCHGPIDRLLRILVDKRVAWVGGSPGGNLYISAEELFGGESREGGVSGSVDFENGGPAQGQNTYLVSKLGADVPSFRGVAGLVLRQCYMGINPYLKAWSFRAQRIHTRQNGLSQWYDEKSAVAARDSAIEINFEHTFMGTGGGATASTAPGAITVSGVDPSDYLVIEIPENPTYKAFSFFASDAESYAAGLKPWATALTVAYNGSETTYNPTRYDTQDESLAYARQNPIFVTGASSYTVYIKDDFASNNRGGISVRVLVAKYFDMNPAHIVRECLTDPDWGMGYQESDVDDGSFITAADTLYSEGFGLSLLWDRQTAIEDFVKEVVRHIQASLYVDRTTGKFKLKLIRADYVEGDLLVLDESCVEKVENFARPSFGDMVNSVTVNYWDSTTATTASVTAQDTALIQMQGAVVGTTIQYPGCTKQALAAKLATRDLRTLSTPLLSCTVYANRKAASLNVGDPFVLDWPDYLAEPTVMRVLGLALGDGRSNKVKITCTEDAFSFPDVAVVRPEVPDWEDPSGVPSAALHRVVEEAPYYELVQRLGQTTTDEQLAANPDIGYLLGSAAAPSAAINARLAVDAGAGYDGNDTPMDFCPVAFLAADLAPGATSVAITGGQALSSVVAGTHAQIGNELVKVVSVTDTLLTVGRGVLDTVPVAHSAGQAVLFWDAYADSDGVEYVAGETAHVKMLPVSGAGQLPLSEADEDAITFTARAFRPYPPGNLKLNGSAYPTHIGGTSDLTVSWSHRDRVQQTAGDLVDTTYGNIGPETGVTYTLRLYNEADVLVHTESGLTGTSYTWPAATEGVESGLSNGGDATFSSNKVLLNFPGADASTSIVDVTGRVWTPAGNAQIDTSLGYNTLLLDGTGDYVTTPHGSDFDWYNNDYTMEAWVLPLSLSTWAYSDGGDYTVMLGWRNLTGFDAVWGFGPTTTGALQFRYYYGTTHAINTASGLIANSQLAHIAMSKVGTTIRLFVNGVLRATATRQGSALQNITAPVSLGQGNNRSLSGHIRGLRLKKGVGIYTADFTPPQAPFVDFAAVGRDRNGRMRIELESLRDGKTSHQAHDYTVRRPGYGFNYGEQYGE